MRFLRSGRLRDWTMRNAAGEEAVLDLPALAVLSDPQAVRAAALMGVGVVVLAVADVLEHLEQGSLLRLLPDWHVDAGTISLYYPSRAQLPAKTRVFIAAVVAAFEAADLARRLSAAPAISRLSARK